MSKPRPGASLFLWHGQALVVGPGIDSSPHAHFAVQMSLSLARPFRVRIGADQNWADADMAVFAPSQVHQIDCGGRPLAHLFVELPQCRPLVRTLVGTQQESETVLTELREALGAARIGQLSMDQAEHAARQWVERVLPQACSPSGFDARIAEVLGRIVAGSGDMPNGSTLAGHVGLSPSRFRHLFRQQTGLPLSRYLLWARLLEAVDAVAKGASMTDAAHDAGFADLAHMSRTFRRTFGVAPSELHKMTIAFKPAGR